MEVGGCLRKEMSCKLMNDAGFFGEDISCVASLRKLRKFKTEARGSVPGSSEVVTALNASCTAKCVWTSALTRGQCEQSLLEVETHTPILPKELVFISHLPYPLL